MVPTHSPRADDPAYRAAITDLLGVLAYGELTAFTRMAADSDLAPTLRLKADLAGLAAAEYRQFANLLERMREMGVDPEQAMTPFVATFAAYHDRTAPKGWLEGLLKAYVGDGIAKDFYREMAGLVDEQTQAVMNHALEDGGESEFVVAVIRDAIRADPTAAGRLALWGRRLLGEALSHGQEVAATRTAMSTLLVGGDHDLMEVGAMFTRLTEKHRERMARLGLTA